MLKNKGLGRLWMKLGLLSNYWKCSDELEVKEFETIEGVFGAEF